MATITQTVEETLTFTAKPPQKQIKIKLQEPASESFEEQKLGSQLYTKSYEEPKLCPPDCEDCKRMKSQICPPGCEECKRMKSQICPPECEECKKLKTGPPNFTNSKTTPLLFNAIGIIIAILATYMIVSTDSNLYLVFWVVYSVLRRMMTKSKPRVKTE